jgi:hypothetical protein
MKTSSKWLCFGSLIFAGLLSLLLSFFGLFGLAWSGFPQKSSPASILGIFLPDLLALPLFAVTVAVWKRAWLFSWFLVPFPAITILASSVHDLKGTSIGVARSLAEFSRLTCPLLILAALVQFGTNFYEFRQDGHWVRWKEASHETAD